MTSTVHVLADHNSPVVAAALVNSIGDIHADVALVPIPGHNGLPVGHLQSADLAVAALSHRPSYDVLVAIGASGWTAQLLALAGRVELLVLVDALGGPWLTLSEAVESDRTRRRALADDPMASAPYSGVGVDPRTAHGTHPMTNKTVAFEAAGALDLDTLVVDTGAGPLAAHEVAAWCDASPNTTLVTTDEVAGAVRSWLDERER